MGAEIGIGALLAAAGISAFGNIAGSGISALGASSSNSQLMDFNSQEAQKNRDFQEHMYNQQLSDQERMYNQYQSPQAIAKQLEKIGVNAAGVFGSGKSGFSGSMSSVPSVPSGSLAQVGSLENPYSSFGQAFQSTTKDAVSVLNSLTDKHLKDAQTVKVLAEQKGQEYANRIAKIQAQVSEWKIPEQSRAEINNLISHAALNEARGNLAAAETSLKELMSKLTSSQIKLTDQQVQHLTIEVAWLDRIRRQEFELLGEKRKTERSQQAHYYASAQESEANTKTIDAIRSDVARYHKSLANITDTKDFVTSNTAWNEVQQSLWELRAAQLVPKELEQAIELARKKKDWYEVNELLGIVDEGVKAYGTYYGAKTGKGFVDAQNVRNDIDRKYKEHLQNKQGRHKVYNVETGDVYWSD